MNITVLGGNGFIGKNIVKKLASKEHKLLVVGRTSSSVVNYENKNICYISADITKSSCFSSLIENTDCLIHLISTTSPKASYDDPIHDVETNLIPFISILEASKGGRLKKIIFASSGGTVYGIPQYSPIDEMHPTNPIVSYGIVKLAMEKYLLSHARQFNIDARILRISNPYGEGQPHEKGLGVITTFLSKVLTKTPIEIWGDGNVSRDFIHVDDVAEAFLDAIDYDGDENIFNISSGVGTTLNEIINMIEKNIGRRVDVNYKESRSFDIPINVLDNKRANNLIGWKPVIDFKSGIIRTIEWMQNHNDGVF